VSSTALSGEVMAGEDVETTLGSWKKGHLPLDFTLREKSNSRAQFVAMCRQMNF
jgi:hypothetical protein